jgi:hypothetical protein
MGDHTVYWKFFLTSLDSIVNIFTLGYVPVHSKSLCVRSRAGFSSEIFYVLAGKPGQFLLYLWRVDISGKRKAVINTFEGSI